MRGHSGHNTRPHSRLPLSCMCMDDPTTERIFDSQATWVIDVLWYFLTLSMGVCTTRHWQTSGRLVQELNVCNISSVKADSAINEKNADAMLWLSVNITHFQKKAPR